MRNKRKSISLLGWIIGALLLIYLGVFCYLNLCKYAQHVDSGYCRRGFAGPGDLGGEGYYTQRLDLQHGETDHWNAYGCSRILRYHRQHAGGGGDYLCSIGCDFAGDILFFSEKIIFEQTGINYGIAGIECAANQRFSQ